VSSQEGAGLHGRRKDRTEIHVTVIEPLKDAEELRQLYEIHAGVEGQAGWIAAVTA